MTETAGTLYAAGHSNRAIGELLEILTAAGISTVADVRRYPRSARHPWFDRDPLAEALAGAGIGYQHFEALGGMRGAPAPEHLPFVATLKEPWSGYAAHARGEAFAAAFEALLRAAERRGPLVLLCAEREPESCHRRLLADAVVLAGRRVVHLVGEGESREHVPHPLAVLQGGRLAYPPRQASLFD